MLCLALLVAGPWAHAQAQVSQWENEIARFEAADKTNPPPRQAILFVGSSSIRLWTNLAQDFKEFPVINRGFGGSQVADSIEFFERIIARYRPRQIVMYAGDNDLAAEKSPQQVAEHVKAFAGKVHAALPQARLAYIAIKPSLARWALIDKIRATNRLISELAAADDRMVFIDVFEPMLGTDGKPRDELLAPDKLHLNAKGYQLWAKLVRPYLK
jgi:lysophospholipase L1-like esterase